MAHRRKSNTILFLFGLVNANLCVIITPNKEISQILKKDVTTENPSNTFIVNKQEPRSNLRLTTYYHNINSIPNSNQNHITNKYNENINYNPQNLNYNSQNQNYNSDKSFYNPIENNYSLQNPNLTGNLNHNFENSNKLSPNLNFNTQNTKFNSNNVYNHQQYLDNNIPNSSTVNSENHSQTANLPGVQKLPVTSQPNPFLLLIDHLFKAQKNPTFPLEYVPNSQNFNGNPSIEIPLTNKIPDETSGDTNLPPQHVNEHNPLAYQEQLPIIKAEPPVIVFEEEDASPYKNMFNVILFKMLKDKTQARRRIPDRCHCEHFFPENYPQILGKLLNN